MPVDDLLVWAAETSRHGPRRPPTAQASGGSANEPQPSTESDQTINRSPSPTPKRAGLPRFFDIGHCAAACSGRCSLHATKEERDDVGNQVKAPLRGVAESLQTQQRCHGRHGQPSFQRDDIENLRLSSGPKPRGLKGKRRNNRLDQAREALLNGDVEIAREIVAAELERLNAGE